MTLSAEKQIVNPFDHRGTHPRVSDSLVEWLQAQGVTRAFGIVGGPCGPLFDAFVRGPIDVVQTRHESGAAFAALEHSLCTGTPGVVFVTTGPGFLNALNGIAAARFDGGRILVVSGTTAISQRGRGAAQETSDHSLMKGLLLESSLFDVAVSIGDASELPAALGRIGVGLAGPTTFIANLALPTSVQSALLVDPMPPRPQLAATGCPAAIVEQVQTALSDAESSSPRSTGAGRFAIWAGAGAGGAAAPLRAFAELTGTRVMTTPRGKGVFPEDHPLYIGTTGLGGHDSVLRSLADNPVSKTLVLGTRMGEVSSLWSEKMVPSNGFIHVDLDPRAFMSAYPAARTLGIRADISALLQGLISNDAVPQQAAVPPPAQVFPAALALRTGPSAVRPQVLMQTVQKIVVDESDAILMSESGASFSWTNHFLRFKEPNRYRVSMTWASMGHMTSGIVGAALTGRKTVAIVGDGAMLMANEVHTAVTTKTNAVWVVLNDARQGIVAQAMSQQGLSSGNVSWPRVNFAKFAESLGAVGLSVTSEGELEAVLQKAMETDGPVVVDVEIDRNESSPMLRQRVASLRMQGAERS